MTARATDLKISTPPVGRRTIAEDKEVSAEGFEPSTNGLKGHCSAIELRARLFERRTAFYHAQL